MKRISFHRNGALALLFFFAFLAGPSNGQFGIKRNENEAWQEVSKHYQFLYLSIRPIGKNSSGGVRYVEWKYTFYNAAGYAQSFTWDYDLESLKGGGFLTELSPEETTSFTKYFQEGQRPTISIRNPFEN